jgi:hypothetical protein
MPPSGYSREQSEAIVKFLSSCSDALLQEASLKGCSFSKALQDESDSIAAALATTEYRDLFARQVLELTRTYYVKLANCAPSNVGEYQSATTDILKSVSDAILSIHVPARSAKI